MASEYAGIEAQNVVDFLAQKYGFEIDPHRSGGYEDSGMPHYADVRQLAGELTPLVTETVGGFILSDAEQFQRLDTGETGFLTQTNLVWLPGVLTMGVGFEHHLGDFRNDDRTSGVWKPSGAGSDFYTHAPDKRMIYIGPGQQHADWSGKCGMQFESVVDYVKVILQYIDEGRLPANKLYTASVGVPQKVMFGDLQMQQLLFDMIDDLELLADEGRVVFATYSEVVMAWKDIYGSEPNIVKFEMIDSQDYTCP
ncbi:MAG: hypothetical protein HQK66_03175 [Desulfamplus sp.]|nr:hypothetical protein [Desulfamplus sp.]